MFNQKMMPYASLLVHESLTNRENTEFARKAPAGYGWILIFEVGNTLYIWQTDNAFIRAHIASTEVEELTRVWVSPLLFDTEAEAFPIYDFLATKRGVKLNGNRVENMPFNVLVSWANENVGFGWGEVFTNDYELRIPENLNEI
jgi:flagellar assembly factor FliW